MYKKLIAFGVAAALVAGLVLALQPKTVVVYDSDGTRREYRVSTVPGATMAKSDCDRFVRESLRAPRTAIFAEISEAVVREEGAGRFVVDSWVDAENGFGAMLRNGFTCIVRYRGEEPVLESLGGPLFEAPR
jgi:hypothetical protein